MKRALLIIGGSVGGLGVVLAVTPPQFGAAGGIKLSTGGATPAQPSAPPTQPTASPTPTATPTPAATKSTTPKATPKAKPTKTTPPAGNPKSAINGTFVGSVAPNQFGNVQVEITVTNGKITNARALQYPNNDFRSQGISKQAIPYLIQETIAANSANIQGVGGASYTSQSWYDSLLVAVKKAGL